MFSQFKGDIELVVQAEDRGRPKRNSTVKVTITVVGSNDVLPPEWVDTQNPDVTIDENVPLNFVLNEKPIKALSRPRGVEVNYAEVHTGRTNLENKELNFGRKTNATDNSMSVFVLKGLDYEKTPFYSLKLRVAVRLS